MAIDLSNYNTVPERITEFREKHPEGSLQSEIVPLPDAFADSFIAVKAYAYRTPDDQRPGIGLAFEPMPGKTPYTKDSELQNAETSAWGRAIVAALASDTKKGIGSAEEIRNRQEDMLAPEPMQTYRRATLREDVQASDVARMRVGEINERLRAAGLSADGTLKVVRARLAEHLDKQAAGKVYSIPGASMVSDTELPIDPVGMSPGPTVDGLGECFAVGCSGIPIAGSDYCTEHNG